MYAQKSFFTAPYILDSQIPLPILFFCSVYSDNSLGLLSFAYLQYLCLFDKII